MSKEHFIKNLKGTMYHQNLALFEFEIKDRQLISCHDLSNQKWWPMEPKEFGMSYRSLNDFFRRRVVQDYAMWLSDYLEGMGLSCYNFEELVKRNNGSNHLDEYWIRFDGIGAQCYDEIWTQKYPIYLTGTI